MITFHLLNGDLFCIPSSQNIKKEIQSYLSTTQSPLYEEWIHIYEYDKQSDEWMDIKDIKNIKDDIQYRLVILPTIFVPWMDESMIAWDYLCRNKNPKTFIYLEESLHNGKIGDNLWNYLMLYLCQIPEAFHLVKQYPDYIRWNLLSCNSHPEAVDMLLANPEKIDWDGFSRNSNPRAVAYLANHPHRIYWFYFCSMNTCPDIVPIMEQYIHYVNWYSIGLSNYDCPEIIDFMIKHADKIDVYRRFSSISNEKIVQYLCDHPLQINWSQLSLNNTDQAIELLHKNKHRICWSRLVQNTNPRAMEIIRENIDEIKKTVEWRLFFSNRGKAIIPFLLEHYDEIKEIWQQEAHLSDIYKNGDAIPLLKRVVEDKLIKLDNNNIDFAMLWMNPNLFV
jgi:hypothetical protein